MTGKLIFKLPQENYEFACASKAAGLTSALWEMDNWLRNKIKYTTENTPAGQTEALEKAREELCHICSMFQINEIVFEAP